MKILYYSVHEVLEFDEVRLLQSSGHLVCSLGEFSPSGSTEKYREGIEFSTAECELYMRLRETGGHFNYVDKTCFLPNDFVDMFDVIIVMHSVDFIENHWSEIRRRPVIWRGIGQDIDNMARRLKPYCREGLHIISYSPKEAEALASLAPRHRFIRFAKRQQDYTGWHGGTPSAITFVNGFASRYPQELGDFYDFTKNIPTLIGGGRNDDIDGSLGFVSETEQQRLYQELRAYIYATGHNIPYTLNFVEAWMTGIPVVVYAPFDRTGKYFEIDELVRHNVTGLVCRTKEEAALCLERLISDYEFAAAIGRNGRSAAIQLFGEENLKAAWQAEIQSAMKCANRSTINASEGGRGKSVYITPNLNKFEKQVFSQFGEDGVIERLFYDLSIDTGTFFEFGVSAAPRPDGTEDLEGCLVNLRKKGWRGVFLDGREWDPALDVRVEFVSALNINDLYVKHALPEDLDIMSIDVDGQELWIWLALIYRPKVMIVEYNGGLPEDCSISIQFDVEHRWDNTIYQGASLRALNKVAVAKGYTLVWSNGVNALFVRNDLVSNKDDFSFNTIFRSYPPHSPDPHNRPWVKI